MITNSHTHRPTIHDHTQPHTDLLYMIPHRLKFTNKCTKHPSSYLCVTASTHTHTHTHTHSLSEKSSLPRSPGALLSAAVSLRRSCSRSAGAPPEAWVC